jgi:hypothetical protein
VIEMLKYLINLLLNIILIMGIYVKKLALTKNTIKNTIFITSARIPNNKKPFRKLVYICALFI